MLIWNKFISLEIFNVILKNMLIEYLNIIYIEVIENSIFVIMLVCYFIY